MQETFRLDLPAPLECICVVGPGFSLLGVEHVLVCSDGVWDVLQDAEAVDLLLGDAGSAAAVLDGRLKRTRLALYLRPDLFQYARKVALYHVLRCTARAA